MGFLKRKEIILLLRVILGVTFIYSSFDKILNPHQFGIAVRAYQIIPLSLSNFFALAVAWTELVAGVLLILGVFTRQAAAAIALLLVMFIGAISIVIVKGMVIDCGCFSPSGGSTVGPFLLIRNFFLLAACFLVMRYDQGFLSLGRLLPARN
jgi:uncharacterized membrane protein YphA (DoxX/SURF4 family)